jgi:uncharacterized membrane protein YraQ (UPF0718 family)
MLALLEKTLAQVVLSFQHNWPFLAFSVLVAALLKVYMNQGQVAALLKRNKNGSIWASVGVATFTPLCSCGTTAVLLGMMASTVPWAPIVAFMVASPLVSPSQTIYSAGLFGWPFAIALILSSIILGLAGGLIAGRLEALGWLAGQARFRPITGGSGAESFELPIIQTPIAPSGFFERFKIAELLRTLVQIGGKLLLFLTAFAFIGYFLTFLIPNAWILGLFGEGRAWGIPLAATFGLPLYFNTEASMPLVRSFLDMGMSPGAALAFLITGAGTSVGATVGILTIARWRVVSLVVGILWVGAILMGFLYNLLLPLF